jgi:lipopolysaccharide/colanic/teichoic acid biosynthesis glycosyltransferase
MGRFANIILATALLLASAPVTLLTALWIKVISPGPVLFKQERVGLNGQPFLILKFRTMDKQPDQSSDGSVTVSNDPRLFYGASTLRAFKIDELPQLLNVLLGSMALVGPRPTVFDDYERMTEEQRGRFLVSPGLTGLAQISGNTTLKWPERIQFDLKYIERKSLMYDLQIIARTAIIIFSRKGETHPTGDSEW